MPGVVKAKTPEKKELVQRRKDLRGLEKELADKELFLSTVKGELHLFSHRYRRIVGGKCAELDDVKAKVLDLACQLNPESAKFKTQAEFARRQARRSFSEMADDIGEKAARQPEEKFFSPSDEIKKLFRETARKIHPDLTLDKDDRERRHKLMAQLNEAYDQMDIEKIRAILQKWEDELKPGEDLPLGAQLARILRQIAQIRKRLTAIDDETDVLKNSEMFQLKESLNSDEALMAMAGEIDAQIDLVKSRVAELSAEVSNF